MNSPLFPTINSSLFKHISVKSKCYLIASALSYLSGKLLSHNGIIRYKSNLLPNTFIILPNTATTLSLVLPYYIADS